MRTLRTFGRPFTKFNPQETAMFNRVGVSLAVTLGVALLVASAAPQLRASEFDKKTIISFSAPVEISGQILPAGTYVFTTLGENRDVVRVMNRDENRVYATVLAAPIETSVIPDHARIELSEGSGNAPEAIHAWFYPGDSLGWEFPSPQAEK
jgi:hypothetical protein